MDEIFDIMAIQIMLSEIAYFDISGTFHQIVPTSIPLFS